MNKKILIIGDASSFFLQDIVNRLHTYNSHLQFDLLPTNSSFDVLKPHSFKHIYYPHLFPKKVFKIITKCNIDFAFFLMRFFLKKVFRKKLMKYDTIHIHFFNKNLLYLDPKYLIDSSSQLLISFWGSDFYKRSMSEKMRMKKYLKNAKIISFSNSATATTFTDVFPRYVDKIKIIRFGLPILDVIDSISATFKKKTLPDIDNISSDKIVLTIGYSSHPDQQHLDIINALKNCEKLDLDRFLFVFPLTYGDKAYADKVVNYAKKLKLNFKAYLTRLSLEEIAQIRLQTDIMLHLRKTDQFSGSFQEHLYAGNIVITGAWLPYQQLLDEKAYFHSIDSLRELPGLLLTVQNDLSEEKRKSIINKEIIASLSAWENIILTHISLY